MIVNDEREINRLAFFGYIAYCNALKRSFNESSLDDQPEDIQIAWRNAAAAIRRRVIPVTKPDKK